MDAPAAPPAAPANPAGSLPTAGRPGPLAVLFGPVFLKEMLVLGRHRSTYWTRAGFVLLLAGVAALVFFGATADASRLPGASALQTLQRVAPLLANVLGFLQLTAITLVAPGLASSAVCDEKRARTLPTLVTTPLSALQIVGGKLTARLAQLMLLVISAAPLLLSVRVFGGLDAEFVAASVALTLGSALATAALALLFSTWHTRAAAAAAFALATYGLLTVAPFFTAMAIGQFRAPPPWFVTATSPFLCLSALLGGGRIVVAPGVGTTQLWLIGAAYQIAIGIAAAALAAASLRRVMLREAAGRPDPGGEGPAPAAAGDGTPAPAVPATKKRPSSRTLTGSPVFWREYRRPAVKSRTARRTLVASVLLGLVWLYTHLPFHSEELHYTVALVSVGVLALLNAQSAPGAVGVEREARTWDALLTSRLSPASILFAKAGAAVARVWYIPAYALAHFGVAAFAGFVHPIFFLHLTLILFACGLLPVCTGLVLGLAVRKATTASSLNLLVLVGLWLVFPVLVGLMGSLAPPAGRHALKPLADAGLAINPFPMIVFALGPALRTPSLAYWPRYEWLGRDDLDPLGFSVILAGSFGALSVIGLVALLVAARRFNRLTDRPS
ncbi:MAG: hypothetical protein JNM07_06450 [Phycisphaerae bacterium]|nr:hypothetical protein [Phycisphaerae bacterium]